MFSRYGAIDIVNSRLWVCIRSPLGSSDCSSPLTTPLKNTARFFHYSAQVESEDGLCLLLDGFTRPAELLVQYTHFEQGRVLRPTTFERAWSTLAPSGWQEYLRPEAFKSFVILTDDNAHCGTLALWDKARADQPNDPDAFTPAVRTSDQFFSGYDDPPQLAAERFDRALTDLSRAHFGTPQARNYRFHSIVGLQADGLVQPTSPIHSQVCGTEVTTPNPGIVYQALSILTGGLRFPICKYQDYSPMFHALAQDVIQHAQLSCDWAIPPSQGGEPVDPRKVNLRHTPSGATMSQIIPKVPSAADCGTGDGWYYDDDAAPRRLISCPASCTKFRADASGEIHIAFGCATVVVR